jgi:hypothetical protein
MTVPYLVAIAQSTPCWLQSLVLPRSVFVLGKKE